MKWGKRTIQADSSKFYITYHRVDVSKRRHSHLTRVSWWKGGEFKSIEIKGKPLDLSEFKKKKAY